MIEWAHTDGSNRQFTWHSENRSVGDHIDIVYDQDDLGRVWVAGVRTSGCAVVALIVFSALAVIAVAWGALLLLGTPEKVGSANDDRTIG